MTSDEKQAEWMRFWPYFMSTALLLIFALIPKKWANICAVILMVVQEGCAAIFVIRGSSHVYEEYSSLYHSIIGYVIYQAACIIFCLYVVCNLVK